MAKTPSDAEIREALRSARTIAVVGLSDKPDRPSNEVARYLQEHGYRIIPVNPRLTEVLGEKAYPDLESIPEPVDIVDVFRRPEDTVPIAESAVRIGAKLLWLQEGVVNEEAARIAEEGGVPVVMDRCILKEHRRLGLD